MKGSFFGNRDVMVPTNDQELDQHCTTIRESLKCLQGFTNDCLKGFVQTAIKMATGNADKHLSKRCDIKKDRDEFLTNAKCLTNKDNMEPFHVCAEKNSVMMEKLVDVALEDRIPAGCCIFHSFQDCIRTNMEKICGDTSRDYWDEVINDIVLDIIKIR
ncbi:uncharacterized protein LOC128958188 [Oppia nitens]|uniref:uncharacterized protein LOC128958188 n=1 Tax=Oppia nitens TaxID=1686743 RepID=UPI0023DBF3BA|nr:uncharacterized protein LOC128958188 [Oppia nitens]